VTAAALLSLGTGAVAIAPGQVLAILAGEIGLRLPWPFEPQQAAVLLAIRFPRVLLGALIGAALAVSGAAMHGLFRNPLADPGLVDVTSGAALAAAVVIVLGATVLHGLADLLGPFALPAAAFTGGLAATLLVRRLLTLGGRTLIATMLLAGIAINALARAGTGLLTFLASDEQLRDLTFWSLGSLGRTTWSAVAIAGPLLLGSIFFIARLARSLNAFLLGEAEAGHLVGLHVERVKRRLVILVALAVGTAVSVAGSIGFVGLVVPHLVRLAAGPDHRSLLPASALLGASLLLGADLAARTIAAPAEVPIGIVTALAGAPFFLWLLLRKRSPWGL
jgi:iron complex transport system permease protein